MLKRVFAASVALAFATVYGNAQSPPLNDNFTGAFEFIGESGTFEGTNNWATSEPGEPATGPASSASIWWRWTAPAFGEFYLNTAGSFGMTVQTAVYVGSSVSNLTTVGGPVITSNLDDSGSGMTLSGPLRVHAGQTYYFRFSGGIDPNGPIRATEGRIAGGYGFTPLPLPPVNDNFSGRLVL